MLDEKDVKTEDVVVEVMSEVVKAVDELVAVDDVIPEVVKAEDEVVIVDEVVSEVVISVVEEEDLVVVVVVVDIFATGIVHLE